MKIVKYFVSKTLLIIMLTGNSFGQGMIFKSVPESKALVRMTASFSDNRDAPDFSVVYFDPNSTTEFDGQLDALKLLNTDPGVPNIFIVTPSDVKISIKALPYAADTLYTVPLGININKAGDVIFKIQNIEGIFSEMKISITDNFTGETHDLLNSQEYQIPLDAGEYTERFILNISNVTIVIPEIEADIIDIVPEVPEVVTAIYENNQPSDNFTIFYANDILKAEISDISGREGSFMLFNLSGQILFQQKIYSEGHHEFIRHVKNGIYLASFNSGNLTTTKKIMVINR
jgi:hypothetical protein